MVALRALIGRLLGHPGPAVQVLAATLGYAVIYLWLTGDLAGGGDGIRAHFPAWARAFESRGTLQFEPVGLIMLGPLVWTFSPINTGLALLVGGLVGLNAAAGWLAWRAPAHCPIPRAGLLASLSALLTGGACCAPLLLVWLGLPVAGAVAVLAPLLIPVSLVLLMISLWRLARHVMATPAGASGRKP